MRLLIFLIAAIVIATGFCDSPYRDYKSRSAGGCPGLACPQGQQVFADHCGCGCTASYTPPDLSNSKTT
ncbi:MAG: hypothetical protein EPN86_05245 [Nanoarchaeota archaeon]|nr:MAG: hypothetical protein EPN86_05245 [Nanoarchaeota archaeon]